MIRGESEIARSLGERCVGLAAGSKDIGVHIETHHLFWTNSFFMGEYADADFHCAKGISLYERNRDHALTYVYSGHDPGVCCRGFSALIQCLYGHPDRSLRSVRKPLISPSSSSIRSRPHSRTGPTALRIYLARRAGACETLGGARDRRLQRVSAAPASFPGDLPARLGARRARRSRRRNRSHARRPRSDQRDGRRDGTAVFRRPARGGAGQGGKARQPGSWRSSARFPWRISMAGASSSPRCCA